jgi:acylglycerol lipase
MVQKLDPALLCRDEIVQQDFVADELCHDTGTLEGLAGMLDRAAGLDTGRLAVPADAGEGGKTRVWLSHGTKDGVCDYHGSVRIYERWGHIEDKELKELEGWLHKRKHTFLSRPLSLTFALHSSPTCLLVPRTWS